MSDVLTVGHTAATLAMFGLMWTVQVVVYPQFRSVGADDFATYVTDHASRIVAALALLAPAEVVFAGWLWLDPPDPVSRVTAFVSGALLAAGWAATGLWYAPLHGKLQEGHDLARIDRLISTNWVRTALWACRAVLAIWFLWRVLGRNG